MRKYNQFLAHQIARFGAMTIPQMQLACAGKCGRATLYRMIDDLLDMGLIKRMPHIGEAKFLFSPRPALYTQIYGEEMKRNTGFNESNILHAAAVTETFLELSRYSFVSGIATEYEIDSSEISKFCHARTPDGIIQITNGPHSFELAVEVERARKSEDRIDAIIEKYKNTFMRNMPCGGLLLVASDKALADLYQSKISKLPSGMDKQCLVVMINELSKLNEKFFGKYNQSAHGSLDKIAIFSQGAPKFSPMNSTQTYLKVNPIPPYVKGQSQICNEV